MPEIRLKAPLIPIHEITGLRIKSFSHKKDICNYPTLLAKNKSSLHITCPKCGKWAHKYGSHIKHDLWTCACCNYTFATIKSDRLKGVTHD
jgi:transposase-like protein